MAETLSTRLEFQAVSSTSVLSPTIIAAYNWMKEGMYAVYRGEMATDNGAKKPMSWGWEIKCGSDPSLTAQQNKLKIQVVQAKLAVASAQSANDDAEKNLTEVKSKTQQALADYQEAQKAYAVAAQAAKTAAAIPSAPTRTDAASTTQPNVNTDAAFQKLKQAADDANKQTQEALVKQQAKDRVYAAADDAQNKAQQGADSAARSLQKAVDTLDSLQQSLNRVSQQISQPQQRPADNEHPVQYALFIEEGGEDVAKWLTLPTLFVRYFNTDPLGNEEIATPFKRFLCFKVRRTLEADSGATTAVLWYDDISSVPVKMAVESSGGQVLYSCTLSELFPPDPQPQEIQEPAPKPVSPRPKPEDVRSPAEAKATSIADILDKAITFVIDVVFDNPLARFYSKMLGRFLTTVGQKRPSPELCERLSKHRTVIRQLLDQGKTYPHISKVLAEEPKVIVRITPFKTAFATAAAVAGAPAIERASDRPKTLTLTYDELGNTFTPKASSPRIAPDVIQAFVETSNAIWFVYLGAVLAAAYCADLVFQIGRSMGAWSGTSELQALVWGACLVAVVATVTVVDRRFLRSGQTSTATCLTYLGTIAALAYYLNFYMQVKAFGGAWTGPGFLSFRTVLTWSIYILFGLFYVPLVAYHMRSKVPQPELVDDKKGDPKRPAQQAKDNAGASVALLVMLWCGFPYGCLILLAH